MNRQAYLSVISIFLLLFCLSACEEKVQERTDGIPGLWLVTSVKVGQRDMTPQGRWIEFKKDQTQYSGNGWRRHSEGTWQLDSGLLNIVNTNGYEDPFNNFEVKINADSMVWNRVEQGDSIQVVLHRTEDLPSTFGDEIMGLWDLDSAFSGKQNILDRYDPDNVRFVHFRWDNRFRDQKDLNSVNSGIYQVHGHYPSVTFVVQGKELEQFQFDYEITDSSLRLHQLNTPIDSALHLYYSRIHQYPRFN